MTSNETTIDIATSHAQTMQKLSVLKELLRRSVEESLNCTSKETQDDVDEHRQQKSWIDKETKDNITEVSLMLDEARMQRAAAEQMDQKLMERLQVALEENHQNHFTRTVEVVDELTALCDQQQSELIDALHNGSSHSYI